MIDYLIPTNYIDPSVIQKIVNGFVSITPLFSYGLTSYQIYVKRTSAGFSVDVCLIMLLSSIFKIVYYMLNPFEISLLRQAIVMIIIQCILLKVALKYLSKPILYENDVLITQSNYSTLGILANYLKYFDNNYKRPYNFWQWFDNHVMYWEFLLAFTIGLITFSLMFKSFSFCVNVIGISGLFIETLLPIPQILLNYRLKSIKNFKSILIVSWLSGDFLKINYLIFGTSHVSNFFVVAALFQASLDLVITGQYFYYRKMEGGSLPGP